MKIEIKTGVKKPIYAFGAALLAASLFAGCTANETDYSEVVLTGNTDPVLSLPAPSVQKKDYSIRPGCDPVNFRYDVTPYRVTEDPYTYFKDKTVVDSELKTYAESKFDQIEDESQMSVRGLYQDYGFEVIRSDMFDEWAYKNGFENWNPNYLGTGAISYMYSNGNDGGTMFETAYYSVYLDPSEKFIVVTSCYDYRVIVEFFEFGNEIKENTLPEDYGVFCETSFNEISGSADECLEWAKENNVVVFEDCELTSGYELWDAFYKTYNKGENASVLIASYYTVVNGLVCEEDADSCPYLVLEYLVYEDGSLHLMTRNCSHETVDWDDYYISLRRFEGVVNPDAAEGEEMKVFDSYVLLYKDYRSWDEIQTVMTDSDSDSRDVKYIVFYWEYVWEYWEGNN